MILVTFEFNLTCTLASFKPIESPLIMSEDLSDIGKIRPPRSVFNLIPAFSKKFIVSSFVYEYKALYKKWGLPGI